MKLFFAVIFILLSGCAQLMKGAVQPVIIKDHNTSTFYTSCSGSVEDWTSCNRKAQDTCKKGYEILDRVESPVGGKREIVFICK